MKRLREHQRVSLAVPTKDREHADVDCVVLLTESNMALLRTVVPEGVEIVDAVDGVALLGFQHDDHPVMLRGAAQQLTASLFRFQVLDGVGIRQLRGGVRLPVRIPAIVSAAGIGPLHGWTVDLSRSGAALALDRPPAESQVTLTLHLPDGREPLQLGATVVRATAAGIAVHFVDVAPESAFRLESFILGEKTRTVWAA